MTECDSFEVSVSLVEDTGHVWETFDRLYLIGHRGIIDAPYGGCCWLYQGKVIHSGGLDSEPGYHESHPDCQPLPEPSAQLMICLGVLGLVWVANRELKRGCDGPSRRSHRRSRREPEQGDNRDSSARSYIRPVQPWTRWRRK